MHRRLTWLILFCFIITSCSTPMYTSDTNRDPAAAGTISPQNVVRTENLEQQSFKVRIERGLQAFENVQTLMPIEGNPAHHLYRHLNRRLRALWKLVETRGGRPFEEKVWYPVSATASSKTVLNKMIAFQTIVRDAEALVASSGLGLKLSSKNPAHAEMIEEIQKARGIFDKIKRDVPAATTEMSGDEALTAARIDLIATLAGQIYRASGEVFPNEVVVNRQTFKVRREVRIVTNALNRLSRLTSNDQNTQADFRELQRIVRFPETSRLAFLAGKMEFEGDLTDGAPIETAALIELAVDIIRSNIAKLTDRQPQSMLLAQNTRAPRTKSATTTSSSSGSGLTVLGFIPGMYDPAKRVKKDETFYGAVTIKGRVIDSIEAVDFEKRKSFRGTGNTVVFDNEVLYPGILNFHNHTKQNNLGTWQVTQGFYENRFEWRGESTYESAVSKNMNPWIGYGAATDCAAFRWSELQAMVWGTTYLQGPSTCVENFGVQRVEDKKAFISKLDGVQAPTDLIYPNEMTFVWKVLRKDILRFGIDKPDSYEKALAAAVGKVCDGPQTSKITAANISEAEGLKIIKDKAILEKECAAAAETKDFDKFIRYSYFIHPTIAGKKNYLKQANRSAVVAHLAEGSRNDAYNRKEYEILKLLGLALPDLVLVHAVGISNFDELREKKMSVVWSPYSNLLLYGETLDVQTAFKAGVKVSLGSDWVPTGSKSPLEEAKLAIKYLKDQRINLKLTNAELSKVPANEKTAFEIGPYRGTNEADLNNNEAVYKMMTEFPARMINHFENRTGESGVGKLEKGSMGTLIAVTKNVDNPFVNLVTEAHEKDINLVVIDGKAIYGNVSALAQAGETKFEPMGEDIVDASRVVSGAPKVPEDDSKESLEDHLLKIGEFAASKTFKRANLCGFAEPKGFVKPDTVKDDDDLRNFPVNLDSPAEIGEFIAVNLLTQSKNATGQDGKPADAVKEFPPLYSCNDKVAPRGLKTHFGRIENFMSDEFTTNQREKNTRRNTGTNSLNKKNNPGKLNALYPD